MGQDKNDNQQATAERSARLLKQKNETDRRIRNVNERLDKMSKPPVRED